MVFRNGKPPAKKEKRYAALQSLTIIGDLSKKSMILSGFGSLILSQERRDIVPESRAIHNLFVLVGLTASVR